jgi:hypothetical protein
MKRLIFAVVAALFLLPALAHAQAPYEPIYGSTNSAQFRFFSTALDMASVQAEGADRFTEQGDADVIGGAFTHWEAPLQAGNRYEVHYQKAWRPFEGQRTRALVDAPVDVITFKGDAETTAVLSGGLETPVNDNWSLTGRAAYGAAWVPNSLGVDGGIALASLGSRYRFPQIGRGDLVLGNMISYSHTVNGFLTRKDPFYGATQNWTYRNGLAYQFPIKTMVMGRQASARFSYTYTYVAGDQVAQRGYNEIAMNFGVRNRESTAKNKFDLLRFGFLFNWGQNIGGQPIKEGTLTVGYRF